MTPTIPSEPIHPNPDFGNIGVDGLTKREYMATAIFQGLSAFNGGQLGIESAAEYAVTAADALINALNKQP